MPRRVFPVVPVQIDWYEIESNRISNRFGYAQNRSRAQSGRQSLSTTVWDHWSTCIACKQTETPAGPHTTSGSNIDSKFVGCIELGECVAKANIEMETVDRGVVLVSTFFLQLGQGAVSVNQPLSI